MSTSDDNSEEQQTHNTQDNPAAPGAPVESEWAKSAQSSEDAEGSEGAEENDAGPRRSWGTIPPVAWVVAAVLLVLAVCGGYVWGQKTATPTTAQIASHAKAGKVTDVPRAKEDGSFDGTVSGPGRKPESASDVLSVHRRNVHDPLAVGAADAPVVITMFSDYYCPYCLRFNTDVEPQLVKEYVDKGLVRLEWNDVPLHGKNSLEAAKAARAAAEQNKFWEFKDALFERVSTLGEDEHLSTDDFVKLAKDVQVPDVEKFTKDATGDRYDEAIENAQQYAQSIGITGTPSFFVGTQFVSGAQPFEQFSLLLDQELAKTASGEVQVPEVAD